MKNAFLNGNRLYLRPLERADMVISQSWINDEAVRKYLTARGPISFDQQIQYFETTQNSHKHRVLAIVLHEGDRYIGNIGLHNIDWQSRVATSGTLIGETDCWGLGYAKEAKLLLLEHAFKDMGLRRVESKIMAPNVASARCQLACGYKLEGVSRQRHFRGGKYVDEHLYAILREDWQEFKANTAM